MSKLPPGWAWATLPDLVGVHGIFSDGDWVETKDQDATGDVRLTQLADIGEGLWRNRSQRYMTTKAADRLGCTYLTSGDVLIARMPDPLGRACLFPGDPRPCVTAVDVCIVRPGRSSVDRRWLMWWLNTPQMRVEVLARQAGTTRKRISRKNLAAIMMPIPPLAEQRRIVAAIEQQLSRLDAADQTMERGARQISRLQKSVLVSIIPDELPAHWKLRQVVDVGRVQLGRQRSPKHHAGPNMKPYLRVANVFEDRLDLSDVMKMDFSPAEAERYRLHPGDILLNEGQSPHLVGRAAMFRGEMEDVCFTNSLIRFQAGADVNAEFALLVFRAHLHSGRFRREARITTNIAHMAAGRFKTVEFPVPPREEQREIVADNHRRLSLIDALDREVRGVLRRQHALRRAVLAHAFRGELVPQDPDDEPASALLARIIAERAAESKSTRSKEKAPA